MRMSEQDRAVSPTAPSSMSGDRTSRIRTLNDRARRALACRVVMTSGVQALGAETLAHLLEQVRNFSTFHEANDPYSEHDFGAFEHENERFFWKSDYYDRDLRSASAAPSDPRITVRVLTLMLAGE